MKKKWKRLLSALVAACMIGVVSPLNALAMDAYTGDNSSILDLNESDNDPDLDQEEDPPLEKKDDFETENNPSLDNEPPNPENNDDAFGDAEQENSEKGDLSSEDDLDFSPDTDAELDTGDSLDAETMLAEFDWLNSEARVKLADYFDGLAEDTRSQAVEDARETLANAQAEPAPAARLLSEARISVEDIADLLSLESNEVQGFLDMNSILYPVSNTEPVKVRYVLEDSLADAGCQLYQGNDLYDEYTTTLEADTGRITAFGVWVSTADDKNQPLQQNKEVTMTLVNNVEGRNSKNLSQTWKFKAGTVISHLNKQGEAKVQYGSYTDEDGDGYSDDGGGFGFAVFSAGTVITIRVSADLPEGTYTHWVDSVFGNLAVAGRVIGNSSEEYYTYCADQSLAYPSNHGVFKFKPELTYRKASSSDMDSGQLANIKGNEQVARVLMAGYPYDRFGLSRLADNDNFRAFMTQNAVWEILDGEKQGGGSYYEALVKYGKTGTLPDGFKATDEVSISVLGDSIELVETLDENSAFDGKYVGVLELSNATDSLMLTAIPKGVTLYPYSEEHPKPGDELTAISLNEKIKSTSGKFYVVSDGDTLEGEIKFSYTKYQIIDPDSLCLFVTDLISVDGEGKNPKKYQPMIGYQWKSEAGTVSASAFRFTKVAGNLEVEKTVTGLEALPDDYTVSLTLTQEGNKSFSKTIVLKRKDFTQKPGEDGDSIWTASVKVRLPYGTYHISETNAAVDGFTLKADTSQTGVVDASGMVNTLTVSNEYDPNNTNGSLTVRKTVLGMENLPEDYQVVLLLTGPQGGESTVREVELTQWVKSQDPQTGAAVWTASKTLTDLPDGTYTLTEKNASELEGYELADVEISAPGTVDREGQPETITAVNSYTPKELTPLAVQKIVTGPANLPEGYSVTLSLYNSAGELVKNVTLSEWEKTGDRTWTASQTVTGLQAGEYVLRETSVSPLNGYILSSVEEGQTGTVGWVPSEQETVTVTNLYQSQPTDNTTPDTTPDYENNNGGNSPSPRPYNPVVYYPDEVIIPDDPVPLTDPPESNDQDPEEIPDDEVPLAQPYEEDGEEILDDDVPLAGIPKTSDTSAAYLYLALSALSAGGLLALKKKKKK